MYATTAVFSSLVLFWKSESDPISWTEWNILINVYVNIDIDKIKPKRLRNDILSVEALPSSKF